MATLLAMVGSTKKPIFSYYFICIFLLESRRCETAGFFLSSDKNRKFLGRKFVGIIKKNYLCKRNDEKRHFYGTESEQKLEIVLLHQGSGGHDWREREPAALLGKGVSAPAPENGEFDGCAAIYREGHRPSETDL